MIGWMGDWLGWGRLGGENILAGKGGLPGEGLWQGNGAWEGGRHRLGKEPGGGRRTNAETDIGWAWDNKWVDGPGWKRGISRWRGPARAGILPGNEGVCPG